MTGAAVIRPRRRLGVAAPPLRRSRLWDSCAFALFVLVTALGNDIRILGSAGLAGLTMAFWMLAVLRFPRVINPLLLALSFWGLCYLVLSLLRLLPAGFTVLYEPRAIPQHAFFVLALMPTVLVAEVWWRRALADRWLLRSMMILLATALLVSPLIPAVRFGAFDVIIEEMFKTLKNNILILMLSLSMLLLAGHWRRLWLALLAAYLVGALVIAGYLQNIAACLIVVGLYGLHQINSALVRPAVLLFIALCVAAVMVGLSQAEAIWPVDPNTGIRLIFWRDVLGAMVDTNFVGIGFGREAIRTTYVLETLLEFGDLADPQFIFIGTHSAFMDVLLRLGGVGGLLLVLYLASVFPSSRLPPRIRTHACTVYALVFLCCLVNVALQSPTYMFGIVFALGYLQALKRAYAPAPRPGRDQSG